SLTLGGSNTYTGSTTCSAGTIKIGQDANLGASGNGLTIQI
ncbi:MAG: autotransporter-associated beta strand repeat-containing protein, partial [Parachlamydiales bacterium]